MNEHAKAWIDYRVDAIRYLVEPLDDKGCVQNPDIDKAMHAAATNALCNLREELDTQTETPVGYPKAKHAYIHDADMQRLRALTDKRETNLNHDIDADVIAAKLAFEWYPQGATPEFEEGLNQNRSLLQEKIKQALLTHEEGLRKELDDEERQHLKTVDERDKAEEAISHAYFLITGNSPEWSNAFGYGQACEDIGDVINLLKQTSQERDQLTAQLAKWKERIEQLKYEWVKAAKRNRGFATDAGDAAEDVFKLCAHELDRAAALTQLKSEEKK